MVTLQSVQSHTSLTHRFSSQIMQQITFDIRALWRSVLSTRVKKLKRVG